MTVRGSLLAVALAVALVTAACSSESTEPAGTAVAEIGGQPVDAAGETIPDPPPIPTGPLSAETIADLDIVFGGMDSFIDPAAVRRLGDSDDVRVAWLLSDLLRFVPGNGPGRAAVDSFAALTGIEIVDRFPWGRVTDLLIAWDVPAPPDYVRWKRRPFELIEPGWTPFFDDTNAAIDWRLVSWGGVLIDDRAVDAVAEPCPRGCIPALDDPAVTDAAGGSWYPDDGVVFGVVIEGEARAYPKNIMEVHEMVNDTLGGRRIGIPYCTLCGSAQAWFTDDVPDGFETIELRTSGLLARSNKVMFDLHTNSVFDTFVGTALSGPLQDSAFTLDMATVEVATWGDWKAAHPETTIVAEDGGIGRSYPDDPLRGRDDEGPIFPVGDVDARLSVHEQVLGVVTPDGQAVAFPVTAARASLDAGTAIGLGGVEVSTDGGGLRATTADGTELSAHQAFWFAWSQFHPDTLLWQLPPVG